MKYVRLKLSEGGVREMLGFSPNAEIKLVGCSIEHSLAQYPVLEIVLSGEDLPDSFKVGFGEIIPKGVLMVKQVRSQVLDIVRV